MAFLVEQVGGGQRKLLGMTVAGGQLGLLGAALAAPAAWSLVRIQCALAPLFLAHQVRQCLLTAPLCAGGRQGDHWHLALAGDDAHLHPRQASEPLLWARRRRGQGLGAACCGMQRSNLGLECGACLLRCFIRTQALHHLAAGRPSTWAARTRWRRLRGGDRDSGGGRPGRSKSAWHGCLHCVRCRKDPAKQPAPALSPFRHCRLKKEFNCQ